MSPRAAARCAYGAAIGGFLADLLFTGLHTREIQHPGDAPPGTASDLAGLTIALLILAALALTGYLPAGRPARVTQRAGITAMAASAAAGQLMVASLLGFEVATPISAVGALFLFAWVALVSRLLPGTGTFRLRVTRFGRMLSQAVQAALVLIAAPLPLRRLSLPQLIVAGTGGLAGVVAWLALPAWYLFPGQDVARAAGQAGPVSIAGFLYASARWWRS